MAVTYDAILRIAAKASGAAEVKALTGALQGLGGAAGGIRSVVGSLTGLGAALGAGLGAAGLAVAGKQILDLGDNLDELATRTGTSVELLSKFGLAAQQSGSNLEQVSGAMVKLSKNLGSIAVGGGKDAAAALSALGISAKDSSGQLRNADQVMLDVADRFAALPDGAMKAKLAVDLFGRGGAALVPMLNQGSDAIEQLNTGMSTTFAKNAGLYNDRLAQLQANFTALGVTILDALLPTLIKVTTTAGSAIQQIALWFEANREAIGGFIGQAVGAIPRVVQFFGAIWAGKLALEAITNTFKIASMAQAAFLALSGPAGWVRLLVALPFVAAAGIGLGKAFDAASKKAAELGQNFNAAGAQLEPIKAQQSDILESLQGQNQESALAKQQTVERAELEKAVSAAVEISNRQYDRMLSTTSLITERQQGQASLRQEMFTAEQAVLGVGKAQLENRLSLATNEQARIGIIQQIAEIERRIAKSQYDATVAQINAEAQLIALKRQAVAQEALKAAQAEITAYKMGAQAEQLQRLANARAGAMENLMKIQREEQLVNQIAALKRRTAGAQLQAANIGIQGRVDQAIIQSGSGSGGAINGQPRFYVNTPNGLIPKFAKGGYVNKPTLAMIGEGGEPEYVVPESKASSFATRVMSGERGANAIRPYGRNELLKERLSQMQAIQKFRGSVEGERVLKNQIARSLGFVPGAGSMPTTLRPGVNPSLYVNSPTSGITLGFKGQKVEVRQNLRIDKVERTANGDMVTLAQAQELASKASTDAVNQLIQKLQQPSFRQQIGIR